MAVVVSKTIKKIIIFCLFLGILSVSLFLGWRNFDFLSPKLNLLWSEIKFQGQIIPIYAQTYPKRLIYFAREIEDASQELIEINNGLKEITEQCNCSQVVSVCWVKRGCGPGEIKTFGDPCKKQRDEIKKTQAEILKRNDQLSFLRELLEKEMEWGLESQLRKMDPQEAKELREQLEKLFPLIEKVQKTSQENVNLANQVPVAKCQAECRKGKVCGFQSCIMIGTGPQRHIKLKFKVGVAVDDLDLGQVGIKNFHFGLPDEISPPKLNDLTFTIPSQKVSISLEKRELVEPFSIDLSGSLPLPKAEKLTFSCPKIPALKSPKLSKWPLPKKNEFPSITIKEPPICPPAPSIPLLKKIQEFREKAEKALEKEIEKINEQIKELEEKLNETVDEKEKIKLQKEIDKLKEKHEEAKKQIKTPEVETPGFEWKPSGTPKEIDVKSPEIKTPKLKPGDISISYQCSPSEAGQETVGSQEISWYSQILSWLMEQCVKLPSMQSEITSLTQKAADCYNPEKVIKTIISECDSAWQSYCADPTMYEAPKGICQKFIYTCEKVYDPIQDITLTKAVPNLEISAAIQCQNLFNQEGLSLPPECSYIPASSINHDYYCPHKNYPTLKGSFCVPTNFDPISVLENKCQELKDEGREEPPKPCKILPLFLGKISTPTEEGFSVGGGSCPSQVIADLPAGFGGIGLNCKLGPPSIPKIDLPDIIIPDIYLPKFAIPPFLYVKLPNFIFEDLILPDIELCNLDDCKEIFPGLKFKMPFFDLPSVSRSITVPGLDIPIKLNLRSPSLPPIFFPSTPLKLGDLIMSELELPSIPLPKPKITFGLSGIDTSAIFDLIPTFILNALDIPDRELCISFKSKNIPLVISFPDYYFQWTKFLPFLKKIPKWEIPFCKDVRAFCKEVRTTLQDGIMEKVATIEGTVNKLVDEKFQQKLNEISQGTEEDLTKQIDGVLVEYAEIVKTKIKEIYPQINQCDRCQLCISQNKDYCKKECPEICLYYQRVGKVITITLPERKIPIKLGEKFKESFPEEKNKIPWPEEAKKLNLGLCKPDCEKCLSENKKMCKRECEGGYGKKCSYEKTKCLNACNAAIRRSWCKKKCQGCLSYDLPVIPLCGLSYEKEFPIKTVGFQPRTVTVDFGELGEAPCSSKEASGGNPMPVNEIENNLSQTKVIHQEIEIGIGKIIDVLAK